MLITAIKEDDLASQPILPPSALPPCQGHVLWCLLEGKALMSPAGHVAAQNFLASGS